MKVKLTPGVLRMMEKNLEERQNDYTTAKKRKNQKQSVPQNDMIAFGWRPDIG